MTSLITRARTRLHNSAFNRNADNRPAQLHIRGLPTVQSATRFRRGLQRLHNLAKAHLAERGRSLTQLRHLNGVTAYDKGQRLKEVFRFRTFVASVAQGPFRLTCLLASWPSPDYITDRKVGRSSPEFFYAAG